jgi:hypothetical protein
MSVGKVLVGQVLIEQMLVGKILEAQMSVGQMLSTQLTPSQPVILTFKMNKMQFLELF